MLFALCVLNIWHPASAMPGKDTEMPGLKQRRREKKAPSSGGRNDMLNMTGSQELIMMQGNAGDLGVSKMPKKQQVLELV